MPDIKWNLGWAGNLRAFREGRIRGRHYGDQWGDPRQEPHLVHVVETFIQPFIDAETVALEIGSGGGRWTQFLLPCKTVYCVELNAEMFHYLRERFPGAANLEFIQTDGTDLSGVPEGSVNFVFSFGVLVHLDVGIIENYLKAIKPKMQKDAVLSIQFSNKTKPMARDNPDFSDNSPERMKAILSRLEYRVDIVDDETLPHSTIIKAVKQG